MTLNNVEGADYTLTPTGIQLNNGLTFKDGSHINIRVLDGVGNPTTVNMHIEGKCAELPLKPECSELKYWQANLIGESYVPYEVIGLSPDMKANYCVQWVQVSETNYHYEDPYCSLTPPTEPPLPPTGGPDLGAGVVILGVVLLIAGAAAMVGKKFRRKTVNE